MDTSAFVLCLDDGEARTNEERFMRSFTSEHPFNRWHDKALNFFVFANGTSTYWADHSMTDGLTVYRMGEWVHEAIAAHDASQTNGVDGHDTTVAALEECPLVTTPEIDSLVQSARARYAHMLSQREFVHHETTTLGKDHVDAKSLPVRPTFNVMIQLASRLFYGQSHASWEAVCLAAFHKGRWDNAQVVTESVAKFCAAAAAAGGDGADDVAPLAAAVTRRHHCLLVQAVRDVNTVTNIVAVGGGVSKMMGILHMLWPADEPRPALFEDPLYRRTLQRYITTSLGGESDMDASTIFPLLDMIYVHYWILPNAAVAPPLAV